MQTDEIIQRVADEVGDRDAAAKAVRATLVTLAQQLDEADAHRLAAQLPADLAGAVSSAAGQGERGGGDFDVRSFAAQVAELTGSDEQASGDVVRTVLGVLRRAVSGGEWGALLGQLPPDLADTAVQGRARNS